MVHNPVMTSLQQIRSNSTAIFYNSKKNLFYTNFQYQMLPLFFPGENGVI